MTTAAGVTYHEIEGCSRHFFRCSALAATISTSACATNWRKAQELRPDDVTALHKCRSCRIGAAHCGEAVIERSPIYGLAYCPRCRRGTTRMIRGRVCISCHNRVLEFMKGTNRKGTVPTFRFDPRRIGVISESGFAEIRDEFTADIVEIAIQILRTVPGRIMFCRCIGRTPISTSESAQSVAPAAKPQERRARATRHRPPVLSKIVQRPPEAHWRPYQSPPVREMSRRRLVNHDIAMARLLAREA
jgi:hypothetical protein